MPLTITSSTGVKYHVWQLHAECARSVSPSIEFNEIRNELGNGYRTQILYGSAEGVRFWSVSLPSLAGIELPVPTVIDVNKAKVSREQYLWDLYNDTRITGKPFAFPCPRDELYYLTDFTDSRLTYEKTFRQKLYSTGIELGQVREVGMGVIN